MPLPKTVTAQDFIDEMVEVQEPDVCPETYDWKETRGNWDALLSQVRQEARAEGRREGLKEMDEAWEKLNRKAMIEYYDENPDSFPKTRKLRQEYQQPA